MPVPTPSLGNHQESARIGATPQKGQLPQVNPSPPAFLGIFPEPAHWNGRCAPGCATERLQHQVRVGWQRLTVTTPSALAKGILAEVGTHMARGGLLHPSELRIAVREYARPGRIHVQIQFEFTLGINGERARTHYQAQCEVTNICTSISYHGIPCEDWNGPTRLWQSRRCPSPSTIPILSA